MKAKAKKAKAKKAMTNEAFAELEQSLNQALAYEQGEREGYRVTNKLIPPAPKPRSKAVIVSLRNNLKCSQSAFAKLLNVSVKTVQAWEQGVRRPSDAAKVYAILHPIRSIM